MRPSTHFLQRLSLWVLGQALPETGALRAPARLAMFSIVVAAAAGTLLALGVVAGLIGLYLYLTQSGLSVGASLSLVAAIAVMAGLIVYGIARRQVEQIPEHFDELKLFNRHSNDVIGNAFNLIVGGFLEGLEKPSKDKQSRAEILQAIDQLVAQIDALEDEGDEDDAEVVLELKTPRPRRKAK